MPTVAQAYGSIIVCQMLSNLYQLINVFRYHTKLKTIYIQAGIEDEFAIITRYLGVCRMSNHLDEMTISELKTYIKDNRHDEQACHEALKRLMSLKNPNNPQYSYDLPSEEMEAIFKAKLQSFSK